MTDFIAVSSARTRSARKARRGARAALAAALAMIPGGCSAGVRGEVRDAQTGLPVAGASVEIATSGWGRSEGRIVWDKETVLTARTSSSGEFRIRAAQGGHRLTVRAAGYPRVDTSLCSSSPMIVRIGGQQPGSSRSLRLGWSPNERQMGWSFAAGGSEAEAADSDLAVAQTGKPVNQVELAARFGAAFVGGTGTPPPPPPTGYRNRLSIDLLECGWLFVRTGNGGPAIVRTGSYATAPGAASSGRLILPYEFGSLPRAPRAGPER